MAQQLVPVQAITALTYRGRAYQPGDTCEMVPVDAAVRARTGEVSLHVPAGGFSPAPPEPIQEPAAAPRRKRQYRRRDLVAESQADAAVDPQP